MITKSTKPKTKPKTKHSLDYETATVAGILADVVDNRNYYLLLHSRRYIEKPVLKTAAKTLTTNQQNLIKAMLLKLDKFRFTVDEKREVVEFQSVERENQ